MKSLVLFLIISFNLSANTRELHYKVEQINSKSVEVTLNFQPENGEEELYVPKAARLLYHKQSRGRLRVQGSEVEIKYIIEAKERWKCSSGYMPRIEKDFFHLEGENLFVRPIKSDSDKISMHIEWDGDKTIANSFGTNRNNQYFTTSYLDLKRSVFLGGKYFTIESEKVGNANLHFVFHSKRGNLEENKKMFLKVVREQRRMYGVNDACDYLIAILDDTDKGGGRSFVNACCVYMSQRKSPMDLAWIFSHEHFHTFNGIGTHSQYANEDLTWFIEGFTEFYANRTNVKSGVYDHKTYEKNIIRTIKEYNNSRAKKFSYVEVLKNKREVSFCNRYLYVKGHLFAHYLDKRIQVKSNSTLCLDDFMKEVYKTYKSNDEALSFSKLSRVYANYDDRLLREHFDLFMSSEKLIFDEESILA